MVILGYDRTLCILIEFYIFYSFDLTQYWNVIDKQLLTNNNQFYYYNLLYQVYKRRREMKIKSISPLQ